MDRFDEPKPDLKVQQDTPTLKSEPSANYEQVAPRLATEPAQLALTRADRAPVAAPQEDGALGWDPVSDWFSITKPLIWLVLLLALPWVFSSSLMTPETWFYLERGRNYVLADGAATQGDYATAVKWEEHLLGLLPPMIDGKPKDNHSHHEYFRCFERLGYYHMLGGDFGAARKFFGKAKELLPEPYYHNDDRSYVLQNYGYCLVRDGRSDLAIKELEEAAILRPHSNFILRTLAVAYNNVGRYKDGLAAAQRSAPEDTAGFWERVRRDVMSGDSLEGMGRHADARAKYQTSATSGVDHQYKYASDYLRGGGKYFEDAVDHEATATRWLREALANVTNLPDSGVFDRSTILNDLAKNAMLSKDPQAAINFLELAKALDLKKTDSENIDYARDLYNLAKVKIAINNTSGAKADLEHCLQIRKKLLGANNFLTQQVAKLLSSLK